jgi:geranylgeranyl pyrophosphate synthase
MTMRLPDLRDSSVTSVVNISAATTDAREFFASCRALIDAELDRLLPIETDEPRGLHSAIRWSVFAGGKRFRPALLLATGQTLGAPVENLIRSACALEMIHTYSLIHDDLPSMDDDDLRRGRPTCHVKFGDATAILAGDALQTLAFRTIAEDERLAPELSVQLIATVAHHAGTPGGMVAGQAQDLDAESRAVTKEELEQIHLAKTGALIRVAARCGAIIAGVSEDQLNFVMHYALGLGMLFQITDDLLDVTATAADLGKTPGKDARARKATYPAILGLDGTRAEIDRWHKESCLALEGLSQPTPLLRSIADFIRDREA